MPPEARRRLAKATRPAQDGEGGGVAAALGRPVTTEAQHVRPGPQPERIQRGAATQLPRRPDELGHLRRELVEAVQVVGIGEAAVEASAEALGGLVAYLTSMASMRGAEGSACATTAPSSPVGCHARTEDQAHQVVLDLINESRP